MDFGNTIMFAPGTEVHVANGNDPCQPLISEAPRCIIVSYDDYGIMVMASEGPAHRRRFYISKSTPVIMMEVN